VVLAHGVQLNVFDNDHLVIFSGKEGAVNDLIALAARFGVSARPGRLGSSPIS